MNGDTISRRFARFANYLTYEDLSKDQIYKIKIYLLDWLGSAFAGQTQTPIKIMLDVVHTLGGRPESTVIPDRSKTMSLLAALINGASSHVLEMDDLHRVSILHPAAPIMPAVFAAAERVHASGPEMLVAIAVGYEVGIRVALGVGKTHYHYWHTTSTCGTFGAAAGSAKILGLDEDQFVWALGSAGTQASGLWEFLVESAMSKQLHTGKAALNGLLASLLAQQGFTGACKILEGEKGFFRATSHDFDEEKCLTGLGREFYFVDNSIKYYASCGHAHSAIDAVLQAIKSNPITIEEIDQVNIHIYQAALDLLDNVKPTTPYVAKFNLPFCVATALKYGHVHLGDFSTARLEDPDILRLMEKIKIHSDPELSQEYPKRWPSRAEIITHDGKSLMGCSDFPKGDPENPLSEREIIEKFEGITEGLLSDSYGAHIVDRVMSLENMADVNRIFDDYLL